MIYAKSKSYETALPKLTLWYNKVTESGFKEFTSVAETMQANYPDILNFFNNRVTNASTESFNSKVKAFRAQLRGMTDTKYGNKKNGARMNSAPFFLFPYCGE